jgi:flagellar biosynthesis/type III secretory pathway M-ring protein FliF/YscJ
MAGSEVFINNVKNFIRNTPKSKVYLYLFLFTAVIGGSIIFFSFVQRETYQTLFSGLSTEDASSVVMKLKDLKVPYKLGMGNGHLCAQGKSLRYPPYARVFQFLTGWERNRVRAFRQV